MNKKYKVSWSSNILGNGIKIMDVSQAEQYNLIVYELIKKCANDGKSHTLGMWTVSNMEE